MNIHLRACHYTWLTVLALQCCYTQESYNFDHNLLGYQYERDDQQQRQQQRNPFEIINEWKYLDFEYTTFVQRQRAIANNEFIPNNNLPLGIDVHQNRLFITTPRWKDGVPASLGYLPYPAKERSPAIRPYPNWQAHGDPYKPDCQKLISVYRTSIDACQRLWVIDSGIVNATVKLNQICAPKIVAFDLRTDRMIVSYELPAEQVKEDSLHSNILADVDAKNCQNAHVYITDVWRYGLVVYSLEKQRSWRITNYNFLPNPIAVDFNVYGLNFQWPDGVFGMSLVGKRLYFHPMASHKEFMVSTDLLQNETLWQTNDATHAARHFIEVGDRGALTQSSTSGIASNQVMFYTQVQRDNVGCWHTQKPYTRANQGLLLSSNLAASAENPIQFPNDLKVDRNATGQSIWVMSNRLPIFLYSQLNYEQINFRILRANVNEAIAGTICDPQISADPKVQISMLQEGQCL